MFQTKVVEKIKTTFCIQYLFFSENCAILRWYKTIWHSRAGHRQQYSTCALRAGYLRLQMHTQNNTHCFPLQQWLHGRASMLHYTYIACLVKIKVFWRCDKVHFGSQISPSRHKFNSQCWKNLKFCLCFGLSSWSDNG